MPSIRAVLFDAGFTLLRPDPDVETAYADHAIALGCSVDRASLGARLAAVWAQGRFHADDHATSDRAEREAWHRLTRRVAEPFPELLDAHEEWLASLFTHFDDPASWRVMDGAAQVLDELRVRGVACAVVSNWHTALHRILATHGLDTRMEHVLTSAEVGRRKPHPRIFEAALERLGLQPGSAAHVGDSLTEDVEAARAVGLRAVHFVRETPAAETNGFTTISRLPELLDILD